MSLFLLLNPKQQTQIVALDLLPSAALLPSPTVMAVSIIAGAPFSSAASFPLASLSTTATTLPSFLGPTASLIFPTVLPTNSVGLSLIGSSATIPQPTVSAASIILPDPISLVNGANTFFQSAVLRGAMTVQPAFIGSGAGVASPFVVQVVRLGLVTTGATFQPTVSATATVSIPRLNATGGIFGPAVVTGVVQLNALSAASVMYQPTVSSLVYILPPQLSATAIPAPTVLRGPVTVSLNALTSAASVGGLTVQRGPVYITLGPLGPLSTVIAPVVDAELRPDIRRPYLAVRWRDDNKEWSREVRIDLGAIGETEVVRRLNFTGSFGTRQYEFSCSEGVSLTFGAAEEDIEIML